MMLLSPFAVLDREADSGVRKGRDVRMFRMPFSSREGAEGGVEMAKMGTSFSLPRNVASEGEGGGSPRSLSWVAEESETSSLFESVFVIMQAPPSPVTTNRAV